MADAVARVTYLAEIGDLKNKIASVSADNAKELRKVTSELNAATGRLRAFDRAQKATGQAVEDAAKGQRGMNLALSSTATQIPDVIAQLSAGTGALQVFAQQGLQVVQVNMRSLGQALATFPVAAGAAAAAATLVGGAYVTMAREVKLATELQEAHRAANAALEASERRLEDALLDRAHALGELSDAELRQAQASLSAQRAVLEFAGAQKEQRAELNATRESAEAWHGGLTKWGYLLGPVAGGVTTLTDKLGGFEEKADQAAAEIGVLDAALAKEVQLQKDLRAALEDTASATERDADAKRAAKDATRDLNAALRAQRELVEGVREANDEAARVRQENFERASQDRDAEVAEFGEIYAAVQRASKATEEKAKADAAAAAAAMQHTDAVIGFAADQLGSMATIGEEVAKRLGASAEKQAKFSKAAAVTAIGANTAAAIVKSMALLGPPVPPNFVGIAGVATAAAVGATQAGLALSEPLPEYHDGGMVTAGRSGRRREVPALLEEGEGVLTARGVSNIGGPRALDAANRGHVAPQRIHVEHRYKHRAFGSFIQDNLAMPNSPLAKSQQALRDKVGHA